METAGTRRSGNIGLSTAPVIEAKFPALPATPMRRRTIDEVEPPRRTAGGLVNYIFRV